MSSKDTSYKRDLFIQRKIRSLEEGKHLIEKTIYVNNNVDYFSLFKFIDNSHYLNFVFIDNLGDIVNSISEFELYKCCNLI